MTRYERVVEILDRSVGGTGTHIGRHGAFWRGKTRDEFVNMPFVEGVQVVILGDGANSNLVLALRGKGIFSVEEPEPTPDAAWPKMPFGYDPVPDEDIQFIESWIDDGCPEDDPVAEARDAQERFVWFPTNAPIASSRTDDVYFLDELVGWAVNSNGQIIHTQDGGDSWEVQLQEATVYFRCLGIANSQRGWAGTLSVSRRLYETRNGGASWEVVAALPPLAPSRICGMSVVNDQVVYASGTNYPHLPARMMKTLDGGATWTAWDMEHWATLLVDCYFTDPLTGWVVGGKSDPAIANPRREDVRAVVLQTTDGGATWVDRLAGLDLPLGEWGWKIQFLSPAIGFVSLENFSDAAILKTADGGQTWVRLRVNDPQGNVNLEGVGFISEQMGWVGGWGTPAGPAHLGSSMTADGGLTWQSANEIGLGLNRFRMIGTPLRVAYASGRTVYKYAPVPAEGHGGIMALRAIDGSPRWEAANGEAESCLLKVETDIVGSEVEVVVFSRFGEVVANFPGRVELEGEVAGIRWDLCDSKSTRIPAGSYIVRIVQGKSARSSLLEIS